ncbi:site-specific integrase [Burkholderia sp. WSM2230]|uniref:site-specific integrase n=1 Tax=Burkholderia sp. WSM2230 TaxID=944435 RepID=UPI000429A551|nr:site-specific integrase [Burkholderia sp. WSM2230]
MTNHLLKRGSRYYIRRKIPLDLQAKYQGRKEIVKALGTSDPLEARKLVREESVRLDREFDRVRQESFSPVPPAEPVYDPERGGYVWPLVPGYDFDFAASKYVPTPPRRVLTAAEQKAVEAHEEWLAYEGHDEIARLDLEDEAREERIEEAKEALRRLWAETGTVPTPPVAASSPVVRLSQVRETALEMTSSSPSAGHLAALVGQWAKERTPDVRTTNAADLVVRRFYEHVGRIPVASISRAHVVAFKEKLLESGQTPVNTDKQLTMLRALLNFAVANLQATSNPAQGVRVGERKNARAARLPFDLPALQAIFSTPIYTKGERPEGGAGEAAYWLPLLGLFTGARIEELCQLRPEDIFEETYGTANGESHKCWVLRITDEGAGQGVKNATSIRRVPLHPELLARGFLDYVASQRGKFRVFDKLKPDSKGSESGNWSKWFSKQLRHVCRVENKKMVFHSFRHLFKDLCRNAGTHEDVSDALSGHSSGKVSRRYGGLSYPLAPLVDAVSRIRVPGLQLPI